MASRFQDMPPPGGYRPITWERVAAKAFVNAPILFGGIAASTIIGVTIYCYTFKRIKREELEMHDATLAMEPILQAERDREYLKQIRRNVNAEKELMKDVPGWEAGTWYGQKIYKTVDYDPVLHQTLEEYYCHSRPYARVYRHYLKLRQ